MTNNNINLTSIVPICYYLNIDTEKKQIIKDNIKKTGVYRLTHIISEKSYVGSSIDLSIRFKNYFNTNYLEKETIKNNSKIYRALLKYGYYSFRLDILECCDPAILNEKEQYYLDNLKPKYNILLTARFFYGFKHSIKSIERMRLAKLGRKHDEATKLKLSANLQAYPIKVMNSLTDQVKLFTSIRKTAKFMGIHHSYLAKSLATNKFYRGKGYYITKSLL